ncbi:MAG: hypothetical protein KME64_28295 [Scytonematopsis contorta HA4267-MV1]|nr:hypothetical protein [Scytonematopsis contorta HA4267-MV1]
MGFDPHQKREHQNLVGDSDPCDFHDEGERGTVRNELFPVKSSLLVDKDYVFTDSTIGWFD